MSVDNLSSVDERAVGVDTERGGLPIIGIEADVGQCGENVVDFLGKVVDGLRGGFSISGHLDIQGGDIRIHIQSCRTIHRDCVLAAVGSAGSSSIAP